MKNLQKAMKSLEFSKNKSLKFLEFFLDFIFKKKKFLFKKEKKFIFAFL